MICWRLRWFCGAGRSFRHGGAEARRMKKIKKDRKVFSESLWRICGVAAIGGRRQAGSLFYLAFLSGLLRWASKVKASKEIRPAPVVTRASDMAPNSSGIS